MDIASVLIFSGYGPVKPVKFQIDAAVTCNTISVGTLQSLFPAAVITRSPYLLYPYGNSKALHPIGQVMTHSSFKSCQIPALETSQF